MFSSSLCLLVFLWISLVRCQQSEQSDQSVCSWKDPKYNVSFNFFALKLTSFDYYTVKDSKISGTETDQTEYNYYFNLCDKVLNYPDPICHHPDNDINQFYRYCDELNTSSIPPKCAKSNDDMLPINHRAYAYQLKTDGSICYPLSNFESFDDIKKSEISLIDDLDPTQGIKIKYRNGAWSEDCGANRALTINLKCENEPASVPRTTDVVEPDNARCNYEMTIYTMHGCPSGCMAFANSLCASQGLCGYDFGSNRSRCFCYYGYTGSSCELPAGDAIWKPALSKSDNNGGDYVHTIPFQTPLTNPITGLVENKDTNITYDLTDAHNAETVYQINDTADKLNDYQYYFNIGGTVDTALLPKTCQTNVTKPCKYLPGNITRCNQELLWNGNAGQYKPEKQGFAFRYKNGSKTGQPDECLMLGTKMEAASTWKLYDNEDNPAHGIQIVYRNGSYWYNYGGGGDADNPEHAMNCMITINLICPDTRKTYFKPKAGIILDASEVTQEDDSLCNFTASFETAFACPFNCITDNGGDTFMVCSGRGMCIADPSAGFVRCICDERYYGDNCDKEWVSPTPSTSPSGSHSDTGFNVAIAIISILLISFVVAVIYLYMRNKTLEKYAVPILDEHEQIEPRVPDYSDSDSEHFHNRPKIGGAGGGGLMKQEMITMSTDLGNNTKTTKKIKQKRFKKQGKNKYQAQTYSDDDDDDDDDDYSDDQNNGPSAYLAANHDDDDDDDSDDMD